MSVYAYCRVSTMRQAEHGESLEVQQRQLHGYASMNGWMITQTFVEEGISGSKPLNERPRGSEMLAIVQDGDIIVASKLDRVFRSAIDALQMVEELNGMGVKLHLLDLGGDVAGNGLSKLFLTIAAAFAEAERDRIRERIIGVKQDQKERNRYLGGKVPFGWSVQVDGGLLENEEEQTAIQTMMKMKKEGKSLRKIAVAMTDAGFPLSHQGVKKILVNNDSIKS